MTAPRKYNPDTRPERSSRHSIGLKVLGPTAKNEQVPQKPDTQNTEELAHLIRPPRGPSSRKQSQPSVKTQKAEMLHILGGGEEKKKKQKQQNG